MIVESTTIKVPAQVPSPAEDAEQLRNAFKRWSTNKQLIISILAHRNAAQRKLIRDAYAEAFGEDFLKSLEKKLSHDFERCVFLWTLTPPERDAHLAHDATTRSDSSNWVLMEIACTRSPDELSLVKEAYCALYKKSLKEDVAYRTKGDFRELLVPLFGDRDERAEVNMTLAKSEGELLHEKISKKAYSDEEVIRILTTTSKAQLNATLNHYNDAFGNAINKNLKEDSNNKFLKLLMATIACLTRPEKYFEKVLGQAIKGVGTDERALTRVVTTRAEVDMQHIKEEYQKRNSIPLEKAIADDTSRYYKKMLLALVGHEEA